MNLRRHPLGVTAGLLALALMAMPGAYRIRQRDDVPVRPLPPRQVGAWTGEPVAYCQATGCQKEWHGAPAAGSNCPACHSPLFSMSALERDLLPADTSLHKGIFTAPAAPALVVSIVISSRERSSIHRPEVCLVGQGSDLVDSFVHSVERPGQPPLRVTVLELVRLNVQPNGQVTSVPSYYAYWFAGTRGRETPSHYQRMAWMAFDRIVRGEASRWAYIAVAGNRGAADRAYLGELDTFLRELRPGLTPEG